MKNLTYKLLVLALLLSAVFVNSATVHGAIATKHHIVSVTTTSSNTEINAQAPGGASVGDEDWTPEQRGKMDADKFYDGWRPAKLWTLLATALFGGILGLIPAIAISSTPPRQENLGYPNESMMKDERYKAAYQKEAKKIKSRKTWGGFGIGIVIAIVLYVVLTA